MDRDSAISPYRQTTTRIMGGLCAAWMLIAATGCVNLEKRAGGLAAETNEPVAHVAAFIHPTVRIVDDTHEPGRQIPGLAGRVWLFPAGEKHTVTPRGTIEAELYDMSPAEPGAKARKLAEWKFAAHDLRLLMQEDKIGMGYTLFLPWEDYTPAIKKVQLHLTFIAADGTKRASNPTTLNLRTEQDQIQIHREVVPAANFQPRK